MARKKERENYGNGSVTPELGKDGKQKKNRDGQPTWRICITLGTESYIDSKGNRRKRQRKVQKTYHGTLTDARKLCKQMVEEYEHIDHDSAKKTFALACDDWATSMRTANTCSASKLKDYQTMLGQVSVKLGDKPLAEIKKDDVESAIALVKNERGLSDNRHRTMLATVKRVFEFCLDRDWLVKNPCRGIPIPKVADESEVERRSLEHDECARLRACIDRDELLAYEQFEAKEQRQAGHGNLFTRSYLRGLSHISGLIAIRLMLATGMRRGEALGLLWECVDFERGQVTIRKSLNAQMVHKSPKTKKGIRTISVDTDTMAHLHKWKDFQKRALHLVMADDGKGDKRPVELTEKTPVCCSCEGTLLQPRNFARWWGTSENKGYRDTIGFSDLLPHELRHTQATMLLGSGVDVKTVQTRLGHAKSSLTLDVYGHAIPANDKAAADVMGNIYGAPIEPSGHVIELGRKTA